MDKVHPLEHAEDEFEYVVYCKTWDYTRAIPYSVWPSREKADEEIDRILEHPKNAHIDDLKDRVFALRERKKSKKHV